MTAPKCDQCQGPLYPVDLLTNNTVCVECVRKSLDTAHRLKARGQSIASAAHPDDRARVDAAIRAAAATGLPFSANSIRSQHGVVGGVVGAAFTAANKAGLIKSYDGEREPSNSAATHGHPVNRWIGVTAQRSAA